jgi:hypothetical protein
MEKQVKKESIVREILRTNKAFVSKPVFKILPEDQVERFTIIEGKLQRLLMLKVMDGPLGVSVMLNKETLVGPRPTMQSKLLGRFPIEPKYLLTKINECVQNEKP